jgi:hypothetical protein
MIVDRKEFKKFWENSKEYPYIVFCNKNYYIPTLDEIQEKYIPTYNKFISKNNLFVNKNWDCSKFANSFKIICDIDHKNKNDDSHLAVAIAHVNIENSEYNHAINLLIYRKEKDIDYIFFDPQNNKLYKTEQTFKNLEFLYF